ncbi:MAG: hypothetical protein RIC38_06880, partial [Chromatocurvus sp.]
RLTDPAAVEPFFLGGAVTLRRALPQQEARDLCDRLIAGGLDCHLVATFEPAPELKSEPPGSVASAPPPNRFQIRSDPPSPEACDDDSQQLRFLATAVGTGLAGIALLAAVLVRLLWWSPTSPVDGPQGIAAAADGTLYMLAGNWLLVHNRAGSSSARYSAGDLGLRAIDQLLHVRDGMPVLSATAAGADPAVRRLWQCSLTAPGDAPACTALTDEPLAVDSLAASGLTDTLFAITADSALVRIATGRLQERAQLAEINPSLRLVNHRGLLLLNNSEGPGLGVYRPDAGAFGEQLDEILLLHPEAIARKQNRVSDFAHTATARWALLSSDSATGLYGFDDSWAPAQAVMLPAIPAPQRLATWRDRLLVYTPESLRIERINAQGSIEAPLLSDSLDSLARSTRVRGARDRVLFIVSLLALSAAVTIGAVLTWISLYRRTLQRQRSLAPAFLLEHRLRQLQWRLTDPRRITFRHYWTLAASALAILVCASTLTGLTALAAVSLPLLLLTLAARYWLSLPALQIGSGDTDLALVDHRGVYQTGPADTFQVWGPFILRGGVIGCLGLPGIPELAMGGAPARSPPATSIHALGACQKGHPATVLDLIVQSRHPLLFLALAIPTGLVLFTVWRAIPAAT